MMTEQDWFLCEHPEPMLEFLRGKTCERKMRFFALACCLEVRQWIIDDKSNKALQVCELFADGKVGHKKLTAARREAFAVTKLYPHSNQLGSQSDLLSHGAVIALFVCSSTKRYSFEQIASITSGTALALLDRVHGGAVYAPARIVQCALLRDIFGNPFRPLPPRPEAIAPLAEQIYAGAWDKIPLLGEWLQEHGYWSEGEHCLDPNNHHVKGCWVVDWVTGRE
jgi:hypothetical protein